MTNPIGIATDIKSAILELADGRDLPDLLEAVDSLAALASPAQAPAAPSAPTDTKSAAPAAAHVLLLTWTQRMHTSGRPDTGTARIREVLSAHPSRESADAARTALVEKYHEQYDGYRRYRQEPLTQWEIVEVPFAGTLSAQAPSTETHDVTVAFEQFKAWPCRTSISNLRMKLDEAESYIDAKNGVAKL